MSRRNARRWAVVGATQSCLPETLPDTKLADRPWSAPHRHSALSARVVATSAWTFPIVFEEFERGE
jgi:hypothetical protein